MIIIIRYAERDTIAFAINDELFYLSQNSGIPQIFDSNLKLQIVPNIDNWFQSKTQQRYSYRSVSDMASAFIAGLQHNYTGTDLIEFSRSMINTTVKTIFQTNYAREFSRVYWVELMDPGKLQKLIEYIRADFDKFQKQYSSKELYNILCRLWQFSNFHAPSEAAIFETIIVTRLMQSPRIPQYPDTLDIDLEVEKIIVGNLEKTLSEFKNIPDELVENVRKIQSGKL